MTDFNKELHLIKCRTQDVITIKLERNSKLKTLSALFQKLQVLSFWKVIESLVLLTSENLEDSRTLSQHLLVSYSLGLRHSRFLMLKL